MRPRRRTPPLALWLLECSGVDDALAGDLLEELGRGRSRLRFWVEVLAAVSSVLWRTAPRYGRSSLTGALAGLSTSWLLITLASQFLLRMGWLPHAVDWRMPHYLLLLLLGSLCAACAGWIVARMHRAHPVAALVGFVGSVITWPLWKLPFLALLYPSVFSASIQPHLPFLLLSLVLLAPLSILTGARGARAFARPVE